MSPRQLAEYFLSLMMSNEGSFITKKDCDISSFSIRVNGK
jgi:hypothetical protein